MADRTCPVCGNSIPEGAHGSRIYCSKSCNRKSTYRRKYPAWHLVGGGVCAHCADDIPLRPGSVAPTYCTPECRRAAGLGRSKAKYERDKDRVNARKREGNRLRRAAMSKTCPQCASTFAPSSTVKQKFCSKRCGTSARRDASGVTCSEVDCDRPVRAKGVCNMHYKRTLRAEGRMNDKNWTPKRKAAWQKRHALSRGAADAETFDYHEVFERDGWACGICSLPVDPNLRHPDPMSASLDHVIPVSKGGCHTRDNTQCAHLTCNIRKGNLVEVA